MSEVGATAVCCVEGDLDAYQAPLVGDRFAYLRGRASVIIDLSAVPAIDSCGLRVLTRWISQLRAGGSGVSVKMNEGMAARLVRAVQLDRRVAVTTA